MSYKNLYDYCQEQTIPISRKVLKSKLLEVTGKEKLAFAVSSNLNPKDVRGMFLSVGSDNAWAAQHGCDVVVLSRGIWAKSEGGNYCWDRFITCKEMMHLFDTEDEISDTGEKFDQILSAFFMTFDGNSPIVNSEIKGFWRALGVLCPERQRQEFAQKVSAGNMTNYDVALKLRIPEQYVGQLLSDRFINGIEHLY